MTAGSSRALQLVVRPLLQEAGFSQFTERNAWRVSRHTIDHVTFRSFSSYIAKGVGCTTPSFSVEVGVFYRCLDPERQRPVDYRLTFRSMLGKCLRQPSFHPFGREEATDRPDIWYVATDGSNLDEVVDDARWALVRDGLPLLDHYRDPERAFASLLRERPRDVDFGVPGLTMPGLPDSPRWWETGIEIGRLIMDDPRPVMRCAPVLGDD